MPLFAWICLSLLPAPHAPRPVEVDLIELNHVYDGEGRPLLSQHIFWTRHESEFHVRAWALDQGFRAEKRGGRWRLIVFDKERSVEVSALSRVETWTQYDPELLDRKSWPPEQRAGL
jgi:hypothetical protein